MIKIEQFSFFSALFITFSLVFFTQCAKDDDDSLQASGQVNFKITDAPIDNTEVKGAFVTITDIEVDGKTLNLTNKQTIDILAYQNGDTKSLTDTDVEAGSYSNITLVLDYEQDENGNSPGCYILNNNNEKYDFNTSGNSDNKITFSTDDLTVEENSSSAVVIDFDLRKAIKENENNASEKYSFVSNTELSASFRTSLEGQAGVIQGNCSNANNFGERVVVYAYKKGTYNRATEAQGQGSSNIEFKNAVTSATVDVNGDFSLHFLEEGDYETHFFVYEDTDSDGRTEIQGSLQMDIVGSVVDLLTLGVEVNASLTVNVSAIAVIPL